MVNNWNSDITFYNKNSVSIGNRLSVERKDFISTGIVTFVEGDIIEIELSQAKYYNPGDEVKLTVYSANGFLVLASSVIAKDADVIMVLNPPENQRLVQRRQHPRIDYHGSGTLESIGWTEDSVQKLEDPLAFQIQNLSLGGVGILMPNADSVCFGMFATARFNLAGGIQCNIEISRKQDSESGAYIGAKFLGLAPEQLNSLRGFILRTQIDSRIRQRKDKAVI
jgi:c-di-GMP-binding flagellar brake protein YcgR